MLSWVASDSYPAMPIRPIKQDMRRTIFAVPEKIEPAESKKGTHGDGDGGGEDDGLDAKFGKKKAKKIRLDQAAEDDGVWYDMSLWKAMYRATKRRFWVATIIEGVGCKLAPPRLLRCLKLTSQTVSRSQLPSSPA